jgi:AraC family transcriptional regulator
MRSLMTTQTSGAGSVERARRGGLSAWQVNCVIDHIEAHLADKITVTELAALIGVNIGRLFRGFKISVGVTPLHYITLRRVELACKMMRTTREPLCELALACGLSDQSHLTRVFRRTIGMTPGAWRRAIPTPASEPLHNFEAEFNESPDFGRRMLARGIESEQRKALAVPLRKQID